MKSWMLSLVVASAAVMMVGSAQAQATPLSLGELTQCANHVQQLRAESARINRDNDRMDAERISINQRSADLKAEAAQLPRDDLKAHLDLRQRRDAHNAEARNFNTRIEQLKRDIVAVNGVRDRYDHNCENRSYRRADLQTLPAAAQQAMRTGMDDVEVPYLPPGYAIVDNSP